MAAPAGLALGAGEAVARGKSKIEAQCSVLEVPLLAAVVPLGLVRLFCCFIPR